MAIVETSQAIDSFATVGPVTLAAYAKQTMTNAYPYLVKMEEPV